MKYKAMAIIMLLLTGCATTHIECAGASNACLVTRPGYTPMMVYLAACDYPGGTCYEL